jgi:hypothetical protein
MTDLEESIVELREEGLSYHAIQLKLGNPPKDTIKKVLKKYKPELAGDVVVNHGKMRSKW